MSLVVAFVGQKRAIVGGDQRSIAFFGQAQNLEEELYSGQIQTDQQLLSRAKELGSSIQISDGRAKVWKEGEVLVGEVTELSVESQRRRRVYVTPGAYLFVEISGREATVTKRGKSTLIILGNRFTRDLAFKRLGTGKVPDLSAIESTFQEVRNKTASVSQEYTVLSSQKLLPHPEAALIQALRQYCEERAWQISGLQ